MPTPHGFHAVVQLDDGSVLVIGGVVNDGLDGMVSASVARFEAADGSWSVGANMTEDRWAHTATRLADGTVLVAGSHVQGAEPRSSAERYDPDSGAWTSTGSMRSGRGGHTATLLGDGTVLVAGGFSPSAPSGLASAELFNPHTDVWTATGTMGSSRQGQTATLLLDGRVLVVGGAGEVRLAEGPAYGATAELYDPQTGRWAETESLSMARAGHTATLLPDGKVLVVGGSIDDDATARSAELFDPLSGSWTLTSSMASARTGHIATILADASVLVAGGVGLGSDPLRLASAELYDPVRGTWTETASMPAPGSGQTATLLPDGRVLVVGDYDFESHASAAIYDPGSGP